MKLNLIIKSAVLLSMAVVISCQPKKEPFLLPIYGEKSLKENDTVYHTIQPFSFINQYGEAVTNKTIEGKIVVANFFFATCQSICPAMSTNLMQVQKAFEHDDSLLILSHSVNPLHDTVEVLLNYSRTYNAIQNKWHLLTGDKKQIYEIAKSSYLVNAIEDDGTPEGFLHSELLLLIDKKGRIRGMYDGTDEVQVKKLIQDIQLLKSEKADQYTLQ